MLLFYSEHCNHCKMLLDTIQRMQANSIQTVSIDALRAHRKTVPPQIHSVPALMLLPTKQLLFGKQVFDYLLLPGKGVLTNGMGRTSSGPGGPAAPAAPTEPQAFAMSLSNPLGDNFAFIEEEGNNQHRNYTWSSIEDHSPAAAVDPNANTLQSNTRVKKEMLDIDEFKARRAEDLQVIVNTNVTSPPVTTY